MALWYCTHCDSYFDTNEQDHADYERDMCQWCVDENQQPDDRESKDDRSRVIAVIRPPKFNELMTFSRSLGRK